MIGDLPFRRLLRWFDEERIASRIAVRVVMHIAQGPAREREALKLANK